MWHNSYFIVPAVLLVAAGLYAARTRQRVGHVPHPKGLPGRGLPLLDTAFLAGGPGRVFDTALVRMHLGEQVVINRSGLVTLTGAKPYDAVDQAVHDAVGPTGSRELGTLRRMVMRSAAVQEIGDRLADRGLMRRPERMQRARTARRLLWLAMLDVVVFAVLALLLDDNEALHDRPNLWIPGFLLLLGAVALATSTPAEGRITPAGQRQLSLMQGSTPWTPSAGISPRLAGGAVLGALALGGLAAAGLENLELEEAMTAAAAHEEAVRQATASASSSSSYSSSPSSSSSSSCGSSATWCGSSGSSGSTTSSCGSSHHSSCSSSHSSCGSSHSGCGSSHSSCGSSSSSCGSSCGGGCGGS
ncbi:TIGR04222 domain-containing membrane protein [Kitasatospora sp. NPDC017646]|uniref:TIGR04222 domain-containing membrane protein n=1 Tax=Kitasatospora sp. NPDC017646 TaxID=3364024 RepID=UPI0037B36010